MAFLVLFDTDRIQEYVFATQRLRAIRGGSFLLENLNRQTQGMIADHGGTVVYVGGGAGAAEFAERRKAEEFCRALEKSYQQHTLIASITTWIEPRQNNESFFPWIERAERQLRRRKEEKPRTIPVIANPYAKVCDLCGKLPAAVADRREGHICAACRKQLEEGVQSKSSAIYKAIEDQAGGLPVKWPESLEDIGAASEPLGYIGLIYSDGNRMGQRRQQLLQDNPEQARENYVRFSTVVDRATRGAMVAAVLESLGAPVANETYPVQFFITGGDDLLAALPAHQAIPVALRFGELFPEYYEQGRTDESGQESFPSLGQPASVAMGVVLAKENYPLHSLIQTAHELQKAAKKRAWQVWKQQAQDVSTLDFLATSSSLLLSLEEQRRQELAYDGLILTQRPYTVPEGKTLVQLIQNLKQSGFPRNKINDLWRPLYKGRLAACLDYLVLLSRLSDQGSPAPRQALLQVAEDFRLAPFPWRLTPDFYYDTPLLDLAELYDFIQP
jgi:hypothetical protein